MCLCQVPLIYYRNCSLLSKAVTKYVDCCCKNFGEASTGLKFLVLANQHLVFSVTVYGASDSNLNQVIRGLAQGFDKESESLFSIVPWISRPASCFVGGKVSTTLHFI